MNHIVDSYLATWNSTPGERDALLTEHFSPELTYTDPMAQVTGHDGLTALIDGIQAQFPEFVFAPVGTPDGHHDQVRFRWGLGPAGGEPAVIGFDVVVLDSDGRIRDVLGFLDKVPA